MSSEYSASPDSTQPSHYLALPQQVVARLLTVMADGLPRRAYRVEDAMGLPQADRWRVFPTLCALADAGQLLRHQGRDGVDVFTGLPATAPLPQTPELQFGASSDLPDSGRPIPDALAGAGFIRLLSHEGIPLAGKDVTEGPRWVQGTRDDAERWLAGSGNVGLLLKGLVVLDIDPKHTVPRTAQIDRDMASTIADDILNQLVRRYETAGTLMERTRSGGLHLIYRAVPKRVYTEVPIPEWRGDGGPLVECRSGPRRWVILAPSSFRPPLGPMRWLRRTPLADAPDWLPWTPWQRQLPVSPALSTTTAGELSDGFDIRALLREDGWTFLPHHEGYTLVVRPGKDAADGPSATLDRVAPNVLHVFSTAAPIAPGNYNAWAYLVHARYGGDPLAALAAVGGNHGG